MKQYLSGKPNFRLPFIFIKNSKKQSVFPLTQENEYMYFFSGRYALAGAIEALAFKTGDQILVPAYNCGVEIDPLLYFGLKPEYYKVKRNLTIDLNDIQERITNKTKGIIITHYLGFPQPVKEIQEICKRNNLLLIEDCAHSFLSCFKGKPLGSWGDAAFFSPMKTLAIPNGGILVLKNKDRQIKGLIKHPKILSTFFYSTELINLRTYSDLSKLNQFLLRKAGNILYFSSIGLKYAVALYSKLFKKSQLHLTRPDSYSFLYKLYQWDMSNLSKKIIFSSDFGTIREIRRRNFNYFLKYFMRYDKKALLINELPESICPLFFPTIVKSKEIRQRLYETLKKNGIISYPWWDRYRPDIDWKLFPDAVYLKDRLLGLPIHQDLELKHLDIVLNEYKKAFASVQNLPCLK